MKIRPATLVGVPALFALFLITGAPILHRQKTQNNKPHAAIPVEQRDALFRRLVGYMDAYQWRNSRTSLISSRTREKAEQLRRCLWQR